MSSKDPPESQSRQISRSPGKVIIQVFLRGNSCIICNKLLCDSELRMYAFRGLSVATVNILWLQQGGPTSQCDMFAHSIRRSNQLTWFDWQGPCLPEHTATKSSTQAPLSFAEQSSTHVKVLSTRVKALSSTQVGQLILCSSKWQVKSLAQYHNGDDQLFDLLMKASIASLKFEWLNHWFCFKHCTIPLDHRSLL